MTRSKQEATTNNNNGHGSGGDCDETLVVADLHLSSRVSQHLKYNNRIANTATGLGRVSSLTTTTTTTTTTEHSLQTHPVYCLH
jgi:hypothetical protein